MSEGGSPNPAPSTAHPTWVGESPPCKICPTCGRRYSEEFRACTEDGTILIEEAPDQHDDNLIGHVVKDTYVFAKILGEGAMARVYEASHVRLRGKRFAIKVLHPEFCVESEILLRFRREAEAAASIDSRHIIEVYDVDDTPDGRPFMVTELLKGEELGELLFKETKLGILQAISVARQLCDALEAANQASIIHRDLKPENVFLVGDLQRPFVKVLDFGISKDGKRPGTQLTRLGTVMGTPSFMAPEQAKGLTVDHTVDIYAVGGILYNMVTGQRPFDGDNPAKILTDLLTTSPPTPRSLNPEIPVGLERIILRAMAKEPAQRYASAWELDAELRELEDQLDEGVRATITAMAPASAPAPIVPSPPPPPAETRATRTSRDDGSQTWSGIEAPPVNPALKTRAVLITVALAGLLGVTLLVALGGAIMRLAGERGLGLVGSGIVLAFGLAGSGVLAAWLLRPAPAGAHDGGPALKVVPTLLGSTLVASIAFAILWLVSRVIASIAEERIDEVSAGWELVACLGSAGAALAWALIGRTRSR